MSKRKKPKGSETSKSEADILTTEHFFPLAYAFGVLIGLGFLGWILTPLAFGTSLSLAFALWFYLVLPGYCILLHLDLDGLERVILGIPVSGALLPILLYHWNAVGGKISLLATISFILLVSGIAVAAGIWKEKRAK